MRASICNPKLRISIWRVASCMCNLPTTRKRRADFEKAEQLDPRQSLSAAAQGMIAEEKNQNNPDQALATVRSKLDKKPSDPFLWYLQAAILAQKAPAPGSHRVPTSGTVCARRRSPCSLLCLPRTTFWRNSTCRPARHCACDQGMQAGSARRVRPTRPLCITWCSLSVRRMIEAKSQTC